MKIGIIDYGMGNLRSVQKAFEFIGADADFITQKEDFFKFDKIVLPGVGAFSDAINTIKEKQFDIEIKKAIENKTPLLGICLGMQMLFTDSLENGLNQGLNILDGHIVKFEPDVKIPHMGWNTIKVDPNSKLFKNIENDSYVYFVHSYFLQTNKDIVSATTFYGNEIQIAVEHENIFATQFHPEKSGDVGLNILKNFWEV